MSNSRPWGGLLFRDIPKLVLIAFVIGQTQPSTAIAKETVISGVPRVVDGDTIVFNDDRVRLHGIDAPESKQQCLIGGENYECGKNATVGLRKFIGDEIVTCVSSKKDRYQRLIAVCTLGGIDINAAIVEAGWAVAYRRYSKDYVHAETQAEEAGVGIWAGSFELPWEWRKKNK